MSTVPVAAPRAPVTGSGPPPRSPGRVLPAVAVGSVVAVAVVLRFAATSELWLDEALTVNLAALPLSELRGALERDGAPPLFYVLLHGWAAVFGEGRVAVRALPGLLSVAALVPAFFVGRRLARWAPGAPGGFVPWALVLVLASSPYAIRYATEVRMYSLTVLLVLLGQLALARVLERPSPLRVVLLGGVVAALLYTQYWSIYLLAVVGVVLLVAALRGGGRRGSRAAVAGLVVGALCFVPWLPTFLSQTAHTGTPWGTAPPLTSGLAFALLDFGSMGLGEVRAEAWALAPLLALAALLGVFGLAIDPRRVELDLRTRPPVRWEGVVTGATLVVGLTAGMVAGTAFQGRYAAVVFPLYAACVAFGLTVFADRRVRVVALSLLVVLGLAGGVRNATTERTQAPQVADALAAAARPGDVVAYCPDQVAPDVDRLLDDDLGLRQLTYPSGDGPELVDWVDYAERNEAADPEAFAAELLAMAGDAQVFLVWQGGYLTYEDSCERLLVALQAARPGAAYLVEADGTYFERQSLVRFPPP